MHESSSVCYDICNKGSHDCCVLGGVGGSLTCVMLLGALRSDLNSDELGVASHNFLMSHS